MEGSGVRKNATAEVEDNHDVAKHHNNNSNGRKVGSKVENMDLWECLHSVQYLDPFC